MSTVAELTLKSLRKHRTMMIVFGIVFGLGADDFLGSLWKTGSVSAASAYWVAHTLPDIPEGLIFLGVIFAAIVAWEVGTQSQEDGYLNRDDGYRPARDD